MTMHATTSWTLIPQAQRVYFTAPTHCPVCQFPLQRDGEYLLCKGPDCPACVLGGIVNWVKKVGVLHVGDSLIEALIDSEFVKDPADLYLLDVDKVADLEIGGRRVGGTADKAITNLNAKKDMPIHVFVGSLGIPLIGRSMAQTIAEAGYDTLSKMYKAKIADIAAIPGVGQTKAEAFVYGFADKAGLVGKLLGEAGIAISVASGALVGTTWCFTGFRDATLAAAIEAQGGTVKDSASKSLTYLVALDPNGGSGKLAAARKNGTKVIGKADAEQIAGL